MLERLILELEEELTRRRDHSLAPLLGRLRSSLSEVADEHQQLAELHRRLSQAYEVIEKSRVVVMEWTLEVNVPTKFISENISQYGYKPEDFYTGYLKDYWDFIHPDDRDAARELVHGMRSRKAREYTHRYRVICRDGSIRSVEENTILDYDQEEVLVRERGILYDITNIVELNRRLETSESRYRSLFDRAPAIMFTMRSDGRLTAANRACLDFFDCPWSWLRQRSFCELLDHTADQDCPFDDLPEAVARLAGAGLELNVCTMDGQPRCIHISFDVVSANGQAMEIQAIAQDVTRKKALDEKVRYLSYHDKLTGLYNRTWFDEQLKLMEQSDQYPQSLIVGDMNGLKIANDLFGHKTGDSLLEAMAAILAKSCRASDSVCRLGGDEFVIILPGASEKVAREICRRIQQHCQRSRLRPLNPSIALGHATRHSAEESLERVFKQADDQMYRTKQAETEGLRASLVMSLQGSLEEKTLETRAHGERIKANCLALGRQLGLDEAALEQLGMAALLHDIGKVAVPDEVLRKTGRLSEAEWRLVRSHAEIGYNILNTSARMQGIGEYVLFHHEHWDGSGYPRGLKGEAIPLFSRILALADSFDALCYPREGSPIRTVGEAVAELRRCSGSQFDPDLVERFCSLLEAEQLAFRELH